jgi:hypothetical protein
MHNALVDVVVMHNALVDVVVMHNALVDCHCSAQYVVQSAEAGAILSSIENTYDSGQNCSSVSTFHNIIVSN